MNINKIDQIFWIYIEMILTVLFLLISNNCDAIHWDWDNSKSVLFH